jgi:hypothetical protein
MRANEILNEATIIDKLKGVFKKKKKADAPVRTEPMLSVDDPKSDIEVKPDIKPDTSATKPSRKPKNPGKSAFSQMANQLRDRPETLSPGSASMNQMVSQLTKPKKMKIRRNDPRTALGMKGKGGSPEYQEYLKQLGISQKPASEPEAKLASEPEAKLASEPTVAKTTSKTPRKSSTSSLQAVERVLTNVQNINDRKLLTKMKKIIDGKLGL